jgi:cell wall-associated NlpC family hydrolase
MRSLGDGAWMNDYIGIPYKPAGRTHEALDCYGLCKIVYDEQLDIDLPDWGDEVLQMRARAKTIDDIIHSGEWTPSEEPTEGCFVVCYQARAAHHIGLYFSGGVLHTHNKTGTIFEPLSRFARKFGRIEFGEWTP